MTRILSILILTFGSVFGQEIKSDFEISGNLKVLFGKELLTPSEASIELLPNHKISDLDSLGNFKFTNLKSGIYELRVLDYHFEPELFHLDITDKSIIKYDLVIDANCEISKEVAESDIKKGQPKLILIGGIAPVIGFDDSKFADKYGVLYYDYGCTPPPMECVYQYNHIIFDYLDKKFDKKWRKEVREDVIGLK
ncbi:hypothetical protein [uncultured Algibacter sp.]|uniref:FEKKY domain-containing protein n=1 Tax=uncultured Algibacter sp. TaxID=298659 RepID=UPI0026144D5B|nr:hypothetical protein [uncultured Algibacter sp.]